jgi:hypothetical protein
VGKLHLDIRIEINFAEAVTRGRAVPGLRDLWLEEVNKVAGHVRVWVGGLCDVVTGWRLV